MRENIFVWKYRTEANEKIAAVEQKYIWHFYEKRVRGGLKLMNEDCVQEKCSSLPSEIARRRIRTKKKQIVQIRIS